MEKGLNSDSTKSEVSRLHLLISTGQNVANLVPLGELAHPEEDVWIISSTMAENRGLTYWFKQVLKARGFRRIRSLRVSDEEIRSFHAFRKKLAGMLANLLGNREIYFYLNGGQKVAVLAAKEALSHLPIHYVYMDTHPANIYHIFQENTEKIPIRNSIALDEILKLYASKRSTQKLGKKLYDGIHFLTGNLDYPVEILHYSTHSKFTIELLALVDQINRRKYVPSENEICTDPRYVKWLKEKADQRMEQEINSLIYFLDNTLNVYQKTNDFSLSDIEEKLKNIFKNFYQWLLALPKNKKYAYLRSLREPIHLSKKTLELFHQYGIELKNPIENFDMGTFFEQVVAWRLLSFLNEHPEILSQISEIWFNVEFARQENENSPTGEYDILLVLKTGLLIALECKSFDFTEKDLFARIARLMRRGGLLSEFWVTLPVFTDEQFEPYMEKQKQLYHKLNSLGIRTVPFTMVNQPDTFTLPGQSSTRVTVPTFEEALENYFKPFL